MLHRLWTPGVKRTARRRIQRRRDVAGQDCPLSLDRGVRDRIGRHEGKRVGMLGISPIDSLGPWRAACFVVSTPRFGRAAVGLLCPGLQHGGVIWHDSDQISRRGGFAADGTWEAIEKELREGPSRAALAPDSECVRHLSVGLNARVQCVWVRSVDSEDPQHMRATLGGHPVSGTCEPLRTAQG
jgi:hypothetical protein